MILFTILAAIKSVFLGSIWGRLDGGGIAKTHEWIERSLVMFFPVIACAPFASYWAISAYSGVLGIATGHGQYFLNRMIRAVKPQGTDFIPRLFFGEDPRSQKKYEPYFEASNKEHPAEVFNEIRSDVLSYGMKKLYWRNVLGMFVTGALFALPASVISLVFGHPLYAAIFSLSGFCKAAAYMVSYKFFGSVENPAGTEAAEFINGGLRTALCVSVILIEFLG